MIDHVEFPEIDGFEEKDLDAVLTGAAVSRERRRLRSERILKALRASGENLFNTLEACALTLSGFSQLIEGRTRNADQQLIIARRAGTTVTQLFDAATHPILLTRQGRDQVKQTTATRQAVVAYSKRQDCSFAAIAKRIGCTPGHMANVIACREKSPRIQLALAKLLRRKPVDLFGAFTHPDLLGKGPKATS